MGLETGSPKNTGPLAGGLVPNAVPVAEGMTKASLPAAHRHPAVVPLPAATAELRRAINALPCPAPERADLLAKAAAIPAARLAHADKDGFRVIDHLIDVARNVERKFDRRGNVTFDTIHYLASMLQRTIHPGTSTQDQHGTCGAESLIRMINIVEPGEWARVASELILSGDANLRFGLKLEKPKDFGAGDKSENRSDFDALLQSSFMGAAAPEGKYYSNKHGKFVDKASGKAEDEGMSREAAQKILHAFLSRNAGRGEEPALHKWIEASTCRYGELVGDFLTRANGGQTYISLKWPDDESLHAVILQRYDAAAGRVYFSNPHGETEGRGDGDVLTAPPRVIEQNIIGEQSMSLDDFKKHFTGAFVPLLQNRADIPTDFSVSAKKIEDCETGLGALFDSVAKSELRPRYVADPSFQTLDAELALALRQATRDVPPNFTALEGVVGNPALTGKIVAKIHEAQISLDPKVQAAASAEAMKLLASSPGMATRGEQFFTANAAELRQKFGQNLELNQAKGALVAAGTQQATLATFVRNREQASVEKMVALCLKGQIEKSIQGHLKPASVVPPLTRPSGMVDTSIAGWFNKLNIANMFAQAMRQPKDVRVNTRFPIALEPKPVTERDVFRRKLVVACAVGAATVAMCAFPALVGPAIVSWGKCIGILGAVYCISRRPSWGTAPSYSVGNLGDFEPTKASEASRAMLALFHSVRGNGQNISERVNDQLKEIYAVIRDLEALDPETQRTKFDWDEYVRRIEKAGARSSSIFTRAMKLATPAALTWPVWAPFVGL